MIYIAIIAFELVLLYFLSRNVHLGLGRLFYKLTKSEKWSAYLIAAVFFPGTFVHETAHFLTALFLLVPVGTMDLLPKVEASENDEAEEVAVGVRLGSVPIGQTDLARRTIIGIAPLIFGTAIILGILIYVIGNSLSERIIPVLGTIYVLFEVGNTMFLSKKDLEGAWKFFVLITLFAIAFYAVGFNFNLEKLRVFFTPGVTENLKRAAIFMVVPIAVDLIFVVFMKSVKILQ